LGYWFPRPKTLLWKVLTIAALRQIGNDAHSGPEAASLLRRSGRRRSEPGHFIGPGDLAIDSPHGAPGWRQR
jgi:hypothetical protein